MFAYYLGSTINNRPVPEIRVLTYGQKFLSQIKSDKSDCDIRKRKLCNLAAIVEQFNAPHLADGVHAVRNAGLGVSQRSR